MDSPHTRSAGLTATQWMWLIGVAAGIVSLLIVLELAGWLRAVDTLRDWWSVAAIEAAATRAAGNS